jgi:hypothetical protein
MASFSDLGNRRNIERAFLNFLAIWAVRRSLFSISYDVFYFLNLAI